MTIEEAVRQLGVAIQADDRYKKYAADAKAAYEDPEVIAFRDKLADLQAKFEEEASKPQPDESAVAELQAEYQAQYRAMFQVDSMQTMMQTNGELDNVMNYVMNIIYMTMAGEDPMTCQPTEETIAAMKQSMMGM